MSTSVATTAEGRGTRPSPRWVPVLIAAAVAVSVGLAIGRFLTYTDTAWSPLPEVVVPADDAVRRAQASAEADPDNPAAWREVGVAATRQAIATADPAWYAIAEEALDTAVRLDPDDPFTTIARGQLALSLHDFELALGLGQQATAALPDTADAYGVLVDAQVELGHYEDAAVSAQRMLDADPDLAALARASYLRQLHGDLDGAITAMRQAETAGGGLTGDSSVVSGFVGDLLLHRGDLDGAERAYRRAATPAAVAGLARIAMARGDLDRAADILTDLSQRTPVPAVLTALAEAQTRAGDDAALAATVELNRTLVALQRDAGQTVDLELALFEASYGDPARAVTAAQEAYDARPDNVFAADALAWALYRDGEEARAAALAAQASRLGTVDTAHELRMATITGEGMDALVQRNPLAEDLFLP